MANFVGNMNDVSFTNVITDYDKNYLEDDEFFPPTGNGSYAYYHGTFNYSDESQPNKDTFLGGVVNGYKFDAYRDGFVEYSYDLYSFSLAYSEFQEQTSTAISFFQRYSPATTSSKALKTSKTLSVSMATPATM